MNGDDPLLFGPGLLDEYELCRREFGFDDERMATIALSVVSNCLPTRRPAKPPRRQAWLRIFVVRCGLPCDPPVGGHSCNGG